MLDSLVEPEVLARKYITLGQLVFCGGRMSGISSVQVARHVCELIYYGYFDAAHWALICLRSDSLSSDSIESAVANDAETHLSALGFNR